MDILNDMYLTCKQNIKFEIEQISLSILYMFYEISYHSYQNIGFWFLLKSGPLRFLPYAPLTFFIKLARKRLKEDIARILKTISKLSCLLSGKFATFCRRN